MFFQNTTILNSTMVKKNESETFKLFRNFSRFFHRFNLNLKWEIEMLIKVCRCFLAIIFRFCCTKYLELVKYKFLHFINYFFCSFKVELIGQIIRVPAFPIFCYFIFDKFILDVSHVLSENLCRFCLYGYWLAWGSPLNSIRSHFFTLR